jgi:hypothetical protein
MKPLEIPRGARVYIGAPAQPLPDAIIARLCSLVSRATGLAEAHLPQVYFEGAEAASQLLVLVPLSRSQTQVVLDAVGSQLPSVLPTEVTLDVLPLQAADPLLEPVRNAHCELFVSAEKPTVEPHKPWWKFWSQP